MGGVLKMIGGAVSKIGSFAKKAVHFASGILNGPLGKIASTIGTSSKSWQALSDQVNWFPSLTDRLSPPTSDD